jgi:hypothetical protein
MNKLSKAFWQLRCEGYFAEEDWTLCVPCRWAAINAFASDHHHVVFYHTQYADPLHDTGSTHLARRGDVAEIFRTLNRCGNKIERDGGDDERILAIVGDC